MDKNIDVKINENNTQINNTINKKVGDVNVKIDSVTVSYTHLDVYKRQVVVALIQQQLHWQAL